MAPWSCSPQSHRLEPNASPVRHWEWARTSTGRSPEISPLTRATCVSPWIWSSKMKIRKVPYFVGRSASETLRTRHSVCIRYWMRSAIVRMGIPCSRLRRSSSGRRAIVPSGFMISQITPAGLSPAIRAKSTDASVWPARASTPPSLAWRGRMCPGLARSDGLVLGSMAARMVAARSKAEMPVVIPSTASIVTVKAVWKRAVFSWTMSGSWSC